MPNSVTPGLQGQPRQAVRSATRARVVELRVVLAQLVASPAHDGIVEQAAGLARSIVRGVDASGHVAAARAARRLEELLGSWPEGDGVAAAASLLRQVDLQLREADA